MNTSPTAGRALHLYLPGTPQNSRSIKTMIVEKAHAEPWERRNPMWRVLAVVHLQGCGCSGDELPSSPGTQLHGQHSGLLLLTIVGWIPSMSSRDKRDAIIQRQVWLLLCSPNSKSTSSFLLFSVQNVSVSIYSLMFSFLLRKKSLIFLKVRVTESLVVHLLVHSSKWPQRLP